MVDFSKRVVVPDNVMFTEVLDEGVLLNLDNECYFTLDDVGVRMWLTATTSDSLESACQDLLAEYDVNMEILRRDLGSLIAELESNGLIEFV